MQKTHKSRVVIDSNILISAIITRDGSPSKLLDLWFQDLFILFISENILQEIKEAFESKKISSRYFITIDKLHSWLFAFRSGAEISFPISDKKLEIHCRDKKDDHVLGLALAADSDYLITGDKDLLILNGNKGLNKLQIVTVNHFLTSVK